MSLMELEVERQSNPVDMIEYVAANNDWSFERSGEDEIAMTVEGKWTDYHVSFSWMEEFEALHLGCAFDIKVPEAQRQRGDQAALRDQRSGADGPFRSLAPGGCVIFRQSLLLAGGAEPTNQQVEVLLSSALEPARPISRHSSSSSGPAWKRNRAMEAVCSKPWERRDMPCSVLGSDRSHRCRQHGRRDALRLAEKRGSGRVCRGRRSRSFACMDAGDDQ
jgi:hypothetical protein